MRRVARWALTTICVAGCLRPAGLSARSHGRAEWLDLERWERKGVNPSEVTRIFSLDGSLGVGYFRMHATVPPDCSWRLQVDGSPDDNMGFYPQYDRLGFQWWDYRIPFTQS